MTEPEWRTEVAERWNAHPAMVHMGATVTLWEDGSVHAVIDPVQPYHRGGLGTQAANGAVIAGLFDLVIGLAGYQHTLERRAGVAQLTINYVRPVHGDRIEVIGRPVRVGRNLVFAEARLQDERGSLCATCTGIVAVSGKHDAAAPEAVL